MVETYAKDVERFVTHDAVTWRESMAGSSFLVGIGLSATVITVARLWWRHRVN